MQMNSDHSLLRGITIIVAMSILLAFVHNMFSAKSIPLIRKEVEKVTVSDSDLFRPMPVQTLPAANDTVHALSTKNDEHPDVQVIAPEHERALRNPDSAAAVVAQERKAKEEKTVYRIITLDQFKRLIEKSKPIIFDARDAEGYKKGHVKGARNLYGPDAADRFEQLVVLPRDTLIILYCNNPDCHLGRMAGDFLGVIGFTKMYLYDDGWDGWIQAKMPIDSTMVEW